MDYLMATYYGFTDNKNPKYNGVIYFGENGGVGIYCGDTPGELGQKMRRGFERLAEMSEGTIKTQNMPLEQCVMFMHQHKLHTPRPMTPSEESEFFRAMALGYEPPEITPKKTQPEKPKE